jgi:hypothetical protein
MSDKHLDIQIERRARKIDWPVLSVRLEPEVYEAVLVRAREAGEKPGPWARGLITQSLAEAA